MTATDGALVQLNSLLDEYNGFSRTLNTAQSNADAAKLTHRLQAAIERLSTPTSSYGRDLERCRGLHYTNSVKRLIAVASIAAALRDDIADGWLTTVVELAHADTYAGYLEMAEGLSGQGFKDPAAVIAGTSLEVQLKTLATKHGITLQLPSGAPKKMDGVNAELKASGVYNALEHKQVTAWLAIRNSAAHGDYGDYDDAAVKAMVEGIVNFAAKYPA